MPQSKLDIVYARAPPSSPLSPKRPRDGNSPALLPSSKRTAYYQPTPAKENEVIDLCSDSDSDPDCFG